MTPIGLVTFWPLSLNFIGPKNDWSSSPASASRTLSGSVEPAFSTASDERQAGRRRLGVVVLGSRPPNCAANVAGVVRRACRTTCPSRPSSVHWVEPSTPSAEAPSVFAKSGVGGATVSANPPAA